MKDLPPHLVVVGPTGAGKSDLALDLASQLDGEVISCDSVQLYRGFDIGSAKLSPSKRAGIPHHLIDTHHWSEGMDAHKFGHLARQAICTVANRGRVPIVVGGSGLYLRATWADRWDEGLGTSSQLRERCAGRSTEELFSELQSKDPDRAGQIHPNDRYRIVRGLEIAHVRQDLPTGTANRRSTRYQRGLTFFLHPPRPLLHARIKARTKLMIEHGLIDETKSLLEEGCPREARPMQSIGYQQASSLLAKIPRPHPFEDDILFATRQYAKRQITWFRHNPFDAEVQNPTLTENLISRCREYLDSPTSEVN